MSTSAPVRNLFLMDDPKLYGENDHQQFGQLKIVQQFSDDMTFGLEKCPKKVPRKVN